MADIKTADTLSKQTERAAKFQVVLNLKNWLGNLTCREASGMFEKWHWHSWLERRGC